MQKNTLVNQYDREWKARIKREKNEQFDRYERNWVIPPLFERGEKVLDLASGNSIVGQYLVNSKKCQVSAIDFSPAAVRDAQKRGVKAIVGSVEEKLPFKSNTFDVVFWGDNIEHVLYPAKIMHEIYRVLKPGGRVILSTPNQAYWRYRLYMLINGALPRTEGEDNPPWEWTHIRFFNRSILQQLFSTTSFKELKFIGVSRRRIDRLFLPLSPELFGMIAVVVAQKL